MHRSRGRSRSRSYSKSPAHSSSYSCSRSRSRSRAYSESSGFSSSPSSPSPTRPSITSTILSIENISRNVTAEHLKEIFGQCGTIADIYLPMNGRYPRGVAQVKFEKGEETQKAITFMNGGQLDGNVLECKVYFAERVGAKRRMSRSRSRADGSRSRSKSESESESGSRSRPCSPLPTKRISGHSHSYPRRRSPPRR